MLEEQLCLEQPDLSRLRLSHHKMRLLGQRCGCPGEWRLKRIPTDLNLIHQDHGRIYGHCEYYPGSKITVRLCSTTKACMGGLIGYFINKLPGIAGGDILRKHLRDAIWCDLDLAAIRLAAVIANRHHGECATFIG